MSNIKYYTYIHKYIEIKNLRTNYHNIMIHYLIPKHVTIYH